MTAAHTEGSLLARLDQVERDNGRLRRLSLSLIAITAILAGLAVALMVVAGRYGLPGTTADIVAAKQFVMRDDRGNVRGIWATDEKGAARLLLQDSEGRPRLRLSLLDDGGSGLSLVDAAGNNRLVAALLPDQSLSLVLADADGRTRSVYGLAGDGTSSLVFTNKSGVTRASMGVDRRGEGTVIVSDDRRARLDEPIEETPADSQPADN